MKTIFRYIKKYWFFAVLSPLMMLGEVLVDLSQPTLMSNIVDDGIIKGDIGTIWSIGIRMVVLVAVGGICGMASSYFSSVASQNFGCDLRGDLFDKVMHLSIEQTDDFTTGSLVTRLTNDVTMVQDIVAMALRMFIRAPMNFIGGIFMALSLNVNFALVLIVAMPIEMVLVAIMLVKAAPLFSKVQGRLDKVNSVVQEDVNGARVVKAYVREEHEIERFEKANKDLFDISMNVARLMALIGPIMSVIMNFSVMAIIIVGHLQVQAGNIEVGKIMAAITYITQILMSLMMVSMMFQSLSRSKASLDRINAVLASDPVIRSGSVKISDIDNNDGAVSFRNVSFRYPGTKGNPVLKDINLDIKPGEFVAILGATGSGKTSLVNMIPRFYDATEGTVTVDGVDVKDYDLVDLREKMSFVLQKSELYGGTVNENIRWGKPEATDEEIREAAKIAQADEFITGFTDGYDTHIGEQGASLSGGQKQRVSIARAIVRRPEIIIFDDSTSALDFGTEARLRSALRRELKGTTVIMIAQRIASVMTADRIAVIDKGTIAACGTHDELMKSSAVYRDIYYSQIRDRQNDDAAGLAVPETEGGAV